jgi:hypothetical protein
MTMKRNVGATGAVIRVSLGAAMIASGLMLQSVWGLAGLIPLTTGLLEWCAVNALLGISTVEERTEPGVTAAASR